jgi:hypothetical protein
MVTSRNHAPLMCITIAIAFRFCKYPNLVLSRKVGALGAGLLSHSKTFTLMQGARAIHWLPLASLFKYERADLGYALVGSKGRSDDIVDCHEAPDATGKSVNVAYREPFSCEVLV